MFKQLLFGFRFLAFLQGLNRLSFRGGVGYEFKLIGFLLFDLLGLFDWSDLSIIRLLIMCLFHNRLVLFFIWI